MLYVVILNLFLDKLWPDFNMEFRKIKNHYKVKRNFGSI